jgi:prevent-host-death family protein
MRADQPERVGVRELRQNLSVYLRRVKEGVTLEVTEHGRPVARLAPLPEEELDLVDRWIAEGKATPAVGPIEEILPLRPKVDRETADRLMRALQEQRREKI